MRIEKLLDRLVYLPHDYQIQEERKNALAMIVEELKRYGIVGKKLKIIWQIVKKPLQQISIRIFLLNPW